MTTFRFQFKFANASKPYHQKDYFFLGTVQFEVHGDVL